MFFPLETRILWRQYTTYVPLGEKWGFGSYGDGHMTWFGYIRGPKWRPLCGSPQLADPERGKHQRDIAMKNVSHDFVIHVGPYRGVPFAKVTF